MMTEAILQDLHSKLHAEHRYLTTKAIAIEHSLPRQTAISILGSLPYFDTGKEYTYEITRCIMDKIDGKYVAKLRTNLETIRRGTKRSDTVDPIYSISLKSRTSILAAHEETMCLLSDHQDSILVPDLSCDIIESANGVQKISMEDARKLRISGNVDLGMKKKVQSKKTPAAQQNITTAAQKKVTTAASFFKSESITKKKKPSRNRSIPLEENPKKGNADDFVGDVDEDDEFLKEEEERKKRNAVHVQNERLKRKMNENRLEGRASKRLSGREKIELEDESEMDDKPDKEAEKVGAIDAFASKKIEVAQGASSLKGNKRKKQVLEEKTFIDDNGFLRTETVTVLKDVEDSEATSAMITKNKGKDATKSKPKSSKNMKQQGLMGFFSKKK